MTDIDFTVNAKQLNCSKLIRRGLVFSFVWIFLFLQFLRENFVSSKCHMLLTNVLPLKSSSRAGYKMGIDCE